MPYLIKTSLVVAIGWLTAASAQAQASLPPASAATRTAVQHQTQRLAQELGLSAEQQGRLRGVLLLTRQHMDADRTAHADDPAALRAAMTYDRAKSEELIQQVLTPAQYVRYQQIKAQRIGQLRVTSQTD